MQAEGTLPAPEAISPVHNVAVVGGGPAGLMAAEVLAEAGVQVHLFDRMPSVGRKFLLAGRGGLNLSHAEAHDLFVGRFGSRAEVVGAALQGFMPQDLRDWAAALGVPTFVGSSGRIFPCDLKAAPLLRAWLQRLRRQGVVFHMRHRWLGWRADALRFDSPGGERLVDADATVIVGRQVDDQCHAAFRRIEYLLRGGQKGRQPVGYGQGDGRKIHAPRRGICASMP
jgi:predicted flavoprotein YhiN